jgi:hypothetical protein
MHREATERTTNCIHQPLKLIINYVIENRTLHEHQQEEPRLRQDLQTREAQQEGALDDGRHIFMADIWRPRHPRDAPYVWIPIDFENGKPVVRWCDEVSF